MMTSIISQEPESASAAKMTPSDGSGGADRSGASSPLSRRHQEQVQNLKDKCGVMDGPMGVEDHLINKTKAPVEEPQITSVEQMRSGCADPMSSDRSTRGDSSGAPCPQPLTKKQLVQNLSSNCRRAFAFKYSRTKWFCTKDHPWYAEVVGEVAKLKVDPYLENSEVKVEIREAPYQLLEVRLLHLAVLMGELNMVQKILECATNHIDSQIGLHGENVKLYSALDLAIICGKSKIVDALLEKKAKVNTHMFVGSLQLAVIHARVGQTKNHSKIIQSLVRKGIDIGAKDGWEYSAFYVAVVKGKTDIVKELISRWKDKIQFNEACAGARPPIQIAHEEGFKDIENALMQCDDVKRFIDEAFRDRQAYVDAANAILVGAALIASVTFASWLQPPLNYTTSYHGSSVEYVDVEHNFALGSFWVFNTLSFYFAIGTVVFGAHSVLPRRQLFITENVKKLSQKLLLTSILLAFSVLFVIVAFGIAGFIVLIPILKYRWYMIGPTILGGIVCIGSIGYLFKSLWENLSWNIRNRKKKKSERIRINVRYNYNNDWADEVWSKYRAKKKYLFECSKEEKLAINDQLNWI